MFSKSISVASLTLCIVSVTSNCSAQDAVKDLSWEALVELRAESFKELRDMYQKAQKATPAEREKIAKDYTTLAIKMQSEVFPEIQSRIVDQLNANPDDEQTREVANEVLEYSFTRNNFPVTKSVAETLIKIDPQNDSAANFLGVANFAEHDFENASRILNLAKKNGQLIGNLGGRYLDSAENYIEYWKTEQAIREKEAAAEGDEQLPRVEFKTSRGKIVLELFENEAPNTVANFINLVEKNFYDGLNFHRVIPNFMAQGGCPLSKTDPARAGSGGPGYNIDCEAYRKDARRHFSGSLSMAHAGKDTGGSQFFITHLPTPHLDREVNPESVHTVFGRVVEGLDVARAIQKDDVIESATVIRKRNHEYVPETTPER